MMNKARAKEIVGQIVEAQEAAGATGDASFDEEQLQALHTLIAPDAMSVLIDQEPANEEIVEDANSTFPYRALAALGIETVRITYNGAGDEGWIEEITAEPDQDERVGILTDELEEEIKQAAYNVLEDQHAGWEINEGSQGHLTVNVLQQRTFLHHGENTIKVDYYDTEVK